MATSVFRVAQVVICVCLLLKAVHQYAVDPDWWIYVPVYALGAALCLIPCPKSLVWRALTAVVVVVGGLQVAFTCWSLMHVSKAVLTEQFDEGKYIALTAAAVSMTSGVRLKTAEYKGAFSYLRALILLAFLVCSLPAIAYSASYYINLVPYFETLHQ